MSDRAPGEGSRARAGGGAPQGTPPQRQPAEPFDLPDLERGNDAARRTGLVVGPALFLLLLFLPDLPLDPLQRRAAATTALVAVFWITVAIPVGATSLLPVVLLPLLGVLDAREAAVAYMDDLVLLFLGAFLVALGLERWGVHRRMALAVISVVGTRPRNLVLGFMVAAAFLSMWINNTATTLMMLPIGVAVVAAVGAGPAPRAGPAGAGPAEGRARPAPFAMALLLGIAYASSMGGMATPVGTAPNQVFLGQLQQRFPGAPAIPFGSWFLAWAPVVAVFVLVAWWILTRLALRVGRESTAGAGVVRAERARLGPMGPAERRMAAVFALTAVLWITRADLEIGVFTFPGWSRLVESAQGLSEGAAGRRGGISDATVAVAMGVACFLVPAGRPRGSYLMDWRTAARVPWDVLLLIGGGFCIAKGFRESGLDRVLGGELAPLLAGRSPWLVAGAVVLFMTFLTEVTSNTATTNVLLPVLAQAAVSGGINPLLMMVPATLAASAAFMLPVATPPNAVVFASRLVPIPTMARVGLWLNVTSVILLTVAFQLWVRRLWNLEAGLPAWARP